MFNKTDITTLDKILNTPNISSVSKIRVLIPFITTYDYKNEILTFDVDYLKSVDITYNLKYGDYRVQGKYKKPLATLMTLSFFERAKDLHLTDYHVEEFYLEMNKQLCLLSEKLLNMEV